MPSVHTRRHVLALASAAMSGLAGCSSATRPSGRVSVTPAPVPSDRRTVTESTERLAPPLPPAALDFTVTVEADFGETHPARLEIAVRNAGDTALTALGPTGYVLPFADDDYTGTDWSGDPELLLVPDDAELTVAPTGAEPGPVGAFLPQAPVEGCWSVPFDWPEARGGRSAILHAAPLRPGQTRRHGYGLYFIDECTQGTFSFEHTFDLAAGDQPIELGVHRARLAFDLAISDTMAPLVRVRDPVIWTVRPDE